MEREALLDFHYETSKDYGLLWELAQTQRVICFADHKGYRDICATQRPKPDGSSLSISARGIGYVTGMEFDGRSVKEDFIFQCEAFDVEFIVPPKAGEKENCHE